MLFVAGLNHLNPEITPLVPVLQSYWLMSHVAIIMIGYVFFALCALTGLFNLILMNLLSATNRVKLLFRIREFTLLNEMAMILGLFFMTAGTFLGAECLMGQILGMGPERNMGFNLYCCLRTGTSYPFYSATER